MEEDTIVTDVIESSREKAIQSILSATRGPVVIEPEDVPAEPQDDMVKLKIDGAEVQAPREKVIEAGIRTLQKESAVDKRLWEASEKEKELERRSAELKQMENELLARREQVADETGKQFVDSVFTDPDEAAKTISTLARQVQQVAQKIETAEKSEAEKAEEMRNRLVQHFHTTYEDIAKNKIQTYALNQFRTEVAAENPDLTPVQVIDEAAKRVYETFKIAKDEPPPTRQELKGRMTAPVRQASARVKPPDKPKIKTQAELLDDARRGRSMR